MDLDKALPDDVQLVLRAAALLELSEYDVFRLAFLEWAGEDAGLERLEPIFVRYMFEARVPPWVCSFVHATMGDVESGRVSASSVSRKVSTPGDVGRGARYAVLALVVTAALVVLAQASSTLAGLSDRCLFPPCY